jgi:tRNA threonylcarbamoyladenosine biosynthesis protein TsaE
MNVEHFTTHNSDDTRALGEKLGERLQPGDLVTLSGELGAGKTTLVQGIARGLHALGDVTSPTFVLIIEHDGETPMLHLDAYRLESKCFDAIRDAGVADFLDRTDAVKLVEWPERIADFLPVPQYVVSIAQGDGDDDRSITIEQLKAVAAS